MTNLSANSPALIVMYHYVRRDASVIPTGIRPLLVSEFERQLDWLGERYDVVGADEFVRRLNDRAGSCVSDHVNSALRTVIPRVAGMARNGLEKLSICEGGLPSPPLIANGGQGRPPSTIRKILRPPADATPIAQSDFGSCATENNSKPFCLLTFDDGTKDHAQIVAPIFKRRGLTGVFFVLAWPAELQMMPLTHALHWLLGQGDEGVWESFQRYARDHLGGENALGDPAQAARIYHYESPTRARIKYAANMALPAEATERIIEAAVMAAGHTMGDLAEEWFVSAEDIRKMHAAGMTIASHGCSHRSLQSLGPAGIAAEIHHSSAYITKLTGRKPTWFACPFGASGASADAVGAMRAAMLKARIVASVSTEKRYVSDGEDVYALPRWDTIDLPPRKANWDD